MINPELFVRIINAEAAAGRPYWVAGLAREVHPILYPLRERLHPTARSAVEHYHEAST